MSVLGKHSFNHNPAQSQSLTNKNGIDGEVDDEKEASRSCPYHGIGQVYHPHSCHLAGQEQDCHHHVNALSLHLC